MAGNNFFKDNFALIVGLALPVLLMIGFMVVSSLPPLGDPPIYDLVFSTLDYRGSTPIPVTVQLVVKDGVLKEQYTKVPPPAPGAYSSNTSWRKLYLFDAKTQKVRQLEFGLPDDLDKIEGMKEETVAATKTMKLTTELKAPDGYELSNESYRHGGLVNELLWNWG
ncbi:MAG: hypothetical protein ACREWG_08810, partial [Gammaproteobacteria bacterium]